MPSVFINGGSDEDPHGEAGVLEHDGRLVDRRLDIRAGRLVDHDRRVPHGGSESCTICEH